MSYVPISSGEIASGEPVTTATATKSKNNLDDHENRLQGLESSIASYMPIILGVQGPYVVTENLLKTTTTLTMTLSGIRILVDKAGSSGILEIDVKRKRGGGSFASVFTTLPSLSYTAGDNALSSNGVLNPSMVDVESGDIFQLDITSGQLNGESFLVRIDYFIGA